MKKVYWLIFFSVIFLCQFCAPVFKLEGRKVVKKPYKYFEPYEDVNYSETEERDLTREWIVYSDRVNNKTFDKPGSTTVKKNLDFLERFLVLDETDKYIHIVKDPNVDIDGTLSTSAKDFGWVSKDKMLLWEHCLVTKIGKIDIKAIVLNIVEGVRRGDLDKDESADVFFSKDPGLTKRSENSTSLYELFFIYKQTDNAVLLGRVNLKSGSIQISDVVIGWVPLTRINFWYNRIALEPNQDQEAVKERKSNGIKTTILLDEVAAEDFKKGRTVRERDILWNADTYEERQYGYWRSFPVLSFDTNTGIYQIILMGKSLTIDGYTPHIIDKFNYTLWQRVLFVSRSELGDLINIMDKLSSAKSGNRRQKLKDTWIEILKDHVGDVNEEELEDMTFEEIYEKIFGLPGTSELLKDTKLKYLTNRGVVSDDEIERYSFRIDSKYDKLHSIFNEDNYIYSFRSNEIVYYWLPEDLIP